MLRMPAGMLTQEAGVGVTARGPKAFKGLTLTNLHHSLAIHHSPRSELYLTRIFSLMLTPGRQSVVQSLGAEGGKESE